MPKSEDNVKQSTTTLQQLLPRVLDQIQTSFQQKSHQILESWNGIIGAECAPFTKAVRFEEGVLYVQVKNSMVLSLVNGATYKQKILQKLREKFPNIEVRNISFRIG